MVENPCRLQLYLFEISDLSSDYKLWFVNLNKRDSKLDMRCIENENSYSKDKIFVKQQREKSENAENISGLSAHQ
jgi:hypothetical protein